MTSIAMRCVDHGIEKLSPLYKTGAGKSLHSMGKKALGTLMPADRQVSPDYHSMWTFDNACSG